MLSILVILFVIIAGWRRNIVAAILIVATGAIVQLMFVQHGLEGRRLLGLPDLRPGQVIGSIFLQAAVLGLICYLIGRGARGFWKLRSPPEAVAVDAKEGTAK